MKNDANEYKEEDAALSRLFRAYSPDIATDADFMQRLEQRLDSVEFLRQQMASQRRRNRRASMVSLLIAFILGIIFAFSLPYLQGIFAEALDWSENAHPDIPLILACAAAAFLTILISLTAYDLLKTPVTKK